MTSYVNAPPYEHVGVGRDEGLPPGEEHHEDADPLRVGGRVGHPLDQAERVGEADECCRPMRWFKILLQL